MESGRRPKTSGVLIATLSLAVGFLLGSLNSYLACANLSAAINGDELGETYPIRGSAATLKGEGGIQSLGGASLGVSSGGGDASTPPGNTTVTDATLSTATGAVVRSGGGGYGKRRQWDQWPAIAHEEVGHPLVAKGETFFDHARELYFTGPSPLIDEFLKVYENRPDPVNRCGIRINHAMALFLAVKKLNPTLVVESGVNAGVSTYFIRRASSTARIFAVDPADKPFCDQGERWIDRENPTLTTYYTGSNFVDIMDMDWNGMIERHDVDPETTLVFLDDHLRAFNRIANVMTHGIRHFLVEDNYRQGEGASEADKRSTPKQMLAGGMWKSKGDWLWERVSHYSEFPPLVPPIVAREWSQPRKSNGGFMVASDPNTDIVHPILRPDLEDSDLKEYQKIAVRLGLDPALKDHNSYMQFMNYNQICLLQLTPEAARTAGTAPK